MRNQPPEFANVVLDSLTANIAVLDAHGVIIGVNEPWRRYAEQNRGECRDYYVGQNYLAICERAWRESGDESARALMDGLDAVLHKARDRVQIEYPCRSPSEERWFIARVTACSQRGESRVVVSHEDITDRKLAEIALARADAELLCTKQALERTNGELQRALAREQLLARTDELTGLNNRRYFFDAATQQFEIAMRYGQPLSLMIFDIDHFKRINDEHGHPAGDRVLRHVAAILHDIVRAADILARYGGEEFIVLLPETDGISAQALADRIRTEVAASSLMLDQQECAVTISAGITERHGLDDKLDAMIRRADEALYAAKAQGRNRVVVAHPKPGLVRRA